MPPEILRTGMPPRVANGGLSRTWRSALLRLALGWLVLVALTAGDWAAMARQWWDISTYNHVLLVPPILGWLVFQRAGQLVRLDPVCWWPGLFPVAGAALLWLLGAISGLDLARQAGAVALLACAVPLLLGPRVTAGLWFVLCYMVFLVPFGEELVEVLQTVTARITIALTHLSGIPARVDGVFIDTPAGLFEVAEACSGVKFLIAMVAFGVLAAQVCFVRWRRRTAFMLACVSVPVLANGVRAWGTVFAAQYVGAERASGIDHIVYGWIFFALVLGAVVAAGWRWFDRPVDAPVIDAARIAADPLLARLDARRMPPGWALAGLAAIVLGVQGWAHAADRLSASLPERIALPEVAGWHRVDYRPAIWWEPRAGGADHRLLGRYADAAGREVDVFVALYAAQGEGREAGGFGQGALMPASTWSWQGTGEPFAQGRSERLLGHGRVARTAVTWYRIGDTTSGSNLRLKLAVIADRLLLRARPTTMLILSAEERPGYPAGASIARFLAAVDRSAPEDAASPSQADGSALSPRAWMDRVTGVR